MPATTHRLNIPDGSPWEDTIGYSRAVRIGNMIEVAGTTAMEGDQLVGENNVFAQALFIFQKIERVLAKAGASMKDVVRTRMFVTDIRQWEAVGRAHATFFSDVKPVATMVEVSRLIAPELLVEIEVTAMLNPQPA